MSARVELIELFKKLTPKQAKSLHDNWDNLKRVIDMDDEQGTLTKAFLENIL